MNYIQTKMKRFIVLESAHCYLTTKPTLFYYKEFLIFCNIYILVDYSAFLVTLQLLVLYQYLHFLFIILQFPIKVSFAITINKAQGQTFQYVAINLHSDCFLHGQLYVGLSRTGKPEKQFIILPVGLKTKNVVYSQGL